MRPEEGDADRKGRALLRWGSALTVFYVVFQAGYIYSEWDDLLAMKPDGYAEFLAGVFSPLAFLWLVLGFFQQGVELRNSGSALWLQSEELRAAVEQSKQLVDVTKDQLEHEREVLRVSELERSRAARPILRLRAGTSSITNTRYVFEFHVTNVGADCTDVVVNFDQDTDGEAGLGRLNALRA